MPNHDRRSNAERIMDKMRDRKPLTRVEHAVVRGACDEFGVCFDVKPCQVTMSDVESFATLGDMQSGRIMC